MRNDPYTVGVFALEVPPSSKLNESSEGPRTIWLCVLLVSVIFSVSAKARGRKRIAR